MLHMLQGMDGMVALMTGNALIAFGYIFLGPIPGLEVISGQFGNQQL